MTAGTADRGPSGGLVVVSGNPRAGSRTLGVAEAVARRLAPALGLPGDAGETVDLASLAPEVLTGSAAVTAARDRVAGARVVVVATPVYKASYTGLLKAFLDGYGPDALADVVVVPVVVSAGPAHALAGEVHLRPVLVELGAVVPARTFAVTEAQLADLGPVLDAWVDRWSATVARATPG
ncbi:NADPH-dependent FMN reductase [Promicromonospora thailandica]|uniref:FMN reductase n=1 Tax=Promicromonospora thailandica TaxID=765201 RepID=A0A9X2G4T9_9MICO|nr:NAD(P)H-dependent oxidoreductase [Promicromonospora thailandica]MCP2266804.1 FMN reductase [Promicromonospora thailandica]BFF21975.1 NAD(P)H-dependent oxidoreductase [Promicromonospora thailandica]